MKGIKNKAMMELEKALAARGIKPGTKPKKPVKKVKK